MAYSYSLWGRWRSLQQPGCIQGDVTRSSCNLILAIGELCVTNVFLILKAGMDSGYLWSCPSITETRLRSISHRPQVPFSEGTLDKDQTAALSPTPGSSPCNELVMGKMTLCTSGTITALCNIFRNNAGIITCTRIFWSWNQTSLKN